MDKDIFDVLRYFSLFQYPPTFYDIHTFVRKKVSIRTLRTSMRLLLVKKKLISDGSRYTLAQDKGVNIAYQQRIQYSQQKIHGTSLFIRLLSWFPQIRLIGFSGSVAMKNAKQNDDVDFFIITAEKRMWTGRLIAIIMAEVLGIRRRRQKRPMSDVKHYNNKACLNLFFDESDLSVPQFKQTSYVGHEILQMKPIFVRGDIYDRFIEANRWVFDIFPNSRSKIKNQKSKIHIKDQNYFILRFMFYVLCSIADNIELMLKVIQLFLINRHKTSEIVTPTQLWFFPDDFEKKLIKLI